MATNWQQQKPIQYTSHTLRKRKLVASGGAIFASISKSDKFLLFLPLWEIGEPQGSELLRRQLLGHLHGNQLATTKTNPIYLPHPKEKQIGFLRGALFASISKSD